MAGELGLNILTHLSGQAPSNCGKDRRLSEGMAAKRQAGTRQVTLMLHTSCGPTWMRLEEGAQAALGLPEELS